MDDKPPVLPPELPAPAAPKMSLAARLMNVFAIPGDVFEEVKASRPSTANWLVPALITCLVSAIAAIIVTSQPAIQQKIQEQLDKQEEQFQKQVKEGKMKQADADTAVAWTQKLTSPAMMKVWGVGGAIVYGFGRLFWWATVLWLLGLWFLRVRFGYVKSMEVAGLAGVIGVLGTIVTMLLQVNLSNPASSPSLALLVNDFDQKKISHVVLATFNIFDIWQAGVLASALSRLAGVPFMRGAFVMLTFWIIWHGAQILFASAAMRLAG